MQGRCPRASTSRLTGSFWVWASSCVLSEPKTAAATSAVAKSATATADVAVTLPCRRIGGGAAPHSSVDPSAQAHSCYPMDGLQRGKRATRAHRRQRGAGRLHEPCTSRPAVMEKHSRALCPALLTRSRRSQHQAGAFTAFQVFYFLRLRIAPFDCGNREITRDFCAEPDFFFANNSEAKKEKKKR